MPAQSRAFRLLQISDCHLAADPTQRYRGRNAGEALDRLLPAAAEWKADLVVATGDLSEDGSRESYQRLADKLSVIRAPQCAVPGNHDDALTLREFIPVGPWSGPRAVAAGAWQLVLLDSTRPHRVDGALGDQDVAALESVLTAAPPVFSALALHHHPIPVGSPWIDRYMLEAPQAFLEVVARHAQVRLVTWGHVHQTFESRRGEVRFIAGPSTAVNSLPDRAQFTEDPDGPACRWYELFDDGRIETGLIRV